MKGEVEGGNAEKKVKEEKEERRRRRQRIRSLDNMK